jgi:hypothetical protein
MVTPLEILGIDGQFGDKTSWLQVFGPMIPSTGPAMGENLLWNALVAARVCDPNTPSTARSALGSHRFSCCWAYRTQALFEPDDNCVVGIVQELLAEDHVVLPSAMHWLQ